MPHEIMHDWSLWGLRHAGPDDYLLISLLVSLRRVLHIWSPRECNRPPVDHIGTAARCCKLRSFFMFRLVFPRLFRSREKEAYTYVCLVQSSDRIQIVMDKHNFVHLSTAQTRHLNFGYLVYQSVQRKMKCVARALALKHCIMIRININSNIGRQYLTKLPNNGWKRVPTFSYCTQRWITAELTYRRLVYHIIRSMVSSSVRPESWFAYIRTPGTCKKKNGGGKILDYNAESRTRVIDVYA